MPAQEFTYQGGPNDGAKVSIDVDDGQLYHFEEDVHRYVIRDDCGILLLSDPPDEAE